ncbi:P1 family peptidase [Geosporobacter ferrireducens]|uniref:Aminopeptidase n=1 Tax=Geosporobacter ferrireducens TaxID=1424294 RepID=A0A1D8GIX1_9FIRM|nr:P1 family peptidase [Geosporobacter ferrireducens]AOT70869.1 aminopeptidase [Geosporobacter ferrireducens]MTI53574.1 P1 family peptidase [Geosporobacter ferrireducens]
MKKQKRIRDYGICIGSMPTGKKNLITDVAGVKVGHTTISKGDIKTGVTAVLPHDGNLFQEKVLSAIHVANGFGKTMGSIQIEELGNIETPILMTNTLSIGTVSDALISYMLEGNGDIGLTTGTVNPVVCECNDGYLNDIRGRHVTETDVWHAIRNASEDFEEGGVGAGTGMSCYGLKGGIGSASRIVNLSNEDYTVGALVLTNMGRTEDFLLSGEPLGRWIKERDKEIVQEEDRGSIIMLLATDIPLTERQLKRVAKRAVVGLARTGSYIGHGSGDIVITFTTANKVPHERHEGTYAIRMIHEDIIDEVFQASAEAVEEAILNSMIAAETAVGRNGHIRKSLKLYQDLFERKKR